MKRLNALVIMLAFVSVFVGFLWSASSVSAAIPRQLNYQGFLTDKTGTPVNVPTQMTFRLYISDAATEHLWEETHSVTVANGYYSVLLGGTAALSIPFDRQYWLGVSVGSDPEMTPRTPLTSVAYALRSDIADTVPDGSLNLSKLSTAACASGEIMQKSANGWVCASISAATGSGAISTITAGNGLFTGGLISGNITLEVSFSGTGSASTAARSDHNHGEVYSKKYDKTAIVALAGGDYLSPATALADVATWCGTPSSANLCQVLIMPGEFGLGGTPLQLIPFVHLRGSGPTTTVLRGAMDSLTAGVVNGADDVHVSNLSIVNAGGTNAEGAVFVNSVALFNGNAAPELQNVVIEARGATNSYSVYNSATAPTGRELIVRDSVLVAGTAAIYNGAYVSTFVRTTHFNGEGGVENEGNIVCSTNYTAEKRLLLSTCPGGLSFSIASVMPEYQAPTNTLVTATFNRDMNASTITAATFLLKDSNGVSIIGSVSYDPPTRTAVFTPSVPLPPNTSFSAILTTDVRDARGGKYLINGLPSAHNWQFQTSGTTENTPLTLLWSSPPSGTVIDPAAYYEVSADFGRQLDPRTLVPSTLMLKNEAGSAVAGTFYSAASSVKFLPSSPLIYGATYSVTVSGIKDLSGNNLTEPVSWTFSTTGGVAPIGVNAKLAGSSVVVSWQPVSGATGYNLYLNLNSPPYSQVISNVTSPYTHTGPFTEGASYSYSVMAVFNGKEGALSNSASIYYDTTIPTVISHNNLTVNFSEEMDQATLTNGTFSVRDGSGNLIAGNVSSGQMCDSMGCRQQTVFYPSNPLQAGATYAVTLSTGVKDRGGNALATPVSWNFVQPLDTPYLTVNRSGQNVVLTWPAVTSAASYNLYWSTISGVTKTNGTKIANVTSPYTHSSLSEGTTYYYVLTAVNGALEGTESYQQQVMIDTTAPTVTSSIPTANAIDIAINTPICVFFSEYFPESLWNNSNVALKDAANTNIPGFVNYYGGNCYGRSFTPGSALNYNTTYTLTVSGIKDQAGNAMTSPYTLTFKTALVGTPSNFALARVGNNATLSWSPVGGATGYNLYWSTTPGVTKTNGTKIAGVISPYTHSSLTEGTTYYYVLTALNGAAEGTESNQQEVIIDTIPPSVTGTTPIPNANNVPINTPICINFSEYIREESWNSINVILKDAGNSNIPGFVAYYGNCGRSFFPSTALNYNTTYTLTVGNIKDQAGNSLVAPYMLTFKTALIGIPGNVTATASGKQSTISWQPAGGATSYNIYWSTTPGVTRGNGTKISNATSPYVHQNLVDNTIYYYVVTASDGTNESQESYQVVARVDTVPPTIISISPEANATNVPITTQVCAGFSEEIDWSSSNQSTFTLKDSNGSFIGSGLGCINLQSSLNFNTTYTATITTSVKDRAGNSLASDYSWSFSTTPVQVPGNVTATASGKQATISWQQAGGASSYNIYWSTTPGVSKGNGTKISNVSSPYIHQNLSDNVTYYYVVTAVNSNGESPESFQVQIFIDTVPPTITSTTPALNATNIPITTSVCANFSEDVNPSTVNQNTFNIKDVNGNLVNGNYSAWNRNACIYPSSSLNFNTTYTATVTTGVKDYNGNSLASNYSWSFSTTPVQVPDNISATANGRQATISWQPAGGATSYNIYWSKSYGVTKANGTKIANVSSPYVHQNLTDNTDYFYIITASNSTGESPDSNQVQVRIDSIPPTINSTNPIANATNVPVGTSVCVNFSEDMNWSLFDQNSFTLKDSNGSFIAGGQGVNCISPPSSLNYNTTYTVTITTSVKDWAGNPLASNYSWSFSTVLPNPLDLTATRGNLETSLNWSPVVGASSYNIYWSTSPGVSKSNGIRISGITGISHTHTGLANGSTYYYVVTAVFGATESSESNQASISYDLVSPFVVSTNPNGTDISSWWYIDVNFNETLDQSTVSIANIYLKDASGTQVSNGNEYYGSKVRLYGWGNQLDFGKTYSLTATTGLKDLAGNSMASDYVWTFKTIPLETPYLNSAEAAVGQVTLNWNQVNGATAYNVYWSTTPGVDLATANKVSGAMMPFVQPGLTAGTTYYFVVTAINNSMESPASNEVSAIAQ